MHFTLLLLLFICYLADANCIEDEHSSIMEALQEHSDGNIEKALYLYKKSLKSLKRYSNETSQVYSNIGSIYFEKGKYKVGRNYYLQSIEASNNTNVNAYFNLAVVTTSKFFEHELALEYCFRALSLNKKMIKLYHLISNIYQNLNDIEKADEYLSIAQSLSIESKDEKENWFISSLYELELNETKFITVDNHINISIHCVSHKPYVYYIKNILEEFEAKHLINRGNASLKPSYVSGSVDAKNADTESIAELTMLDNSVTTSSSSTMDGYRNSYNTWLHSDEVIRNIKARVASIVGLPINVVSKSEEVQLVRYRMGEKFNLHHDSSDFHKRHVTVLFYLNTVENGGETWFPYSSARKADTEADLDVGSGACSYDDTENESNISANLTVNTHAINKCIEYIYNNIDFRSSASGLPGLSVTPLQGDGVIFFNHIPKSLLVPFSKNDSKHHYIAAAGGRNYGPHKLDVRAIHAGLALSAPVIRVQKSLSMFQCSNKSVLLVDAVAKGMGGVVHAEIDAVADQDCHSASSDEHETEKWIANLWF